MKKTATFVVVIIALFSVKLVSQVINVSPGYGTLNDAIKTNGWNKTYELQAGGWYGLNATIEIDSSVTIIGATPSSGQMPAMIQTGTNADGTTFGTMFIINADVCMRNIFLVGADLNSSKSFQIFNQLYPARAILDSITVDPSVTMFYDLNNGPCNLRITNSLFLRHSSETNGVWDYPFIGGGGYSSGFDTLYIENNTFVDMGESFFNSLVSFQRGTEAPDKFIWVNHNSFIFGKSDLINAYYTNSTFFTNNLLWEWQILPFTNNFGIWWMNYGDEGPNNTRTCLIKADTVMSNGVPEAFPSQRKYFVTYNYNYRDPKINDLIKTGLDSGKVSYLQYLVNPPSMMDSSREARMFNDKTNFPYFIATKNIEDQPNSDPKFVDPKIYALTDSALVWAGPVEKQFWGFSTDSFPPVEDWAHYYYSLDTAAGYPVAWPRFNGAYTNPSLMTASIEGLPLGDLNWFPAQKAIWQENQAKVMAHILSEDTTAINVTSVKQTNNQQPKSYSLSQNYPNPFNPTTQINYSIPQTGIVTIKVFNLLGQEVATLINQEQKSGNYTINFDASKLASGVYMYQIHSGNYSLTRKMMLLK